MKKIISLGLAVLMIALAVASCKNTGNGDASSTPAASIPTPPASSSQSTPESTPESTPDNKPVEIVFENCDETVYVSGTAGQLKLRTTTVFDESNANVAHYIDEGTELRRIGKHEEWSKVVYQNKEYYTSSKYLSTEKPGVETDPTVDITFEDRDETVYATYESGDSVNYRNAPSFKEGTIAGSVALGTELKRTGIAFDTENNPDGDLGWSRVEIEGKTYYMRNSTLTTEKPTSSETN